MAKGEKLPDNVRTGLEKLSGADLSEVRVHYNSPLPAQRGAQAFSQGNDIHVGPGQQHLVAHEAAHVVQQRQGRVAPNRRSNIGLSTDDAALEVEADLLGHRAVAAR